MLHKPVDGEVHVHYGQIYVVSDDETPDLDDAFAGQTTGLCGAAEPGALWLVTGLHTGNVGFTVEVHDREPELGPEWEDVVEVSFRPSSADTALEEWGGEAAYALGLAQTDHRVRYCARGMDAARELDTRLDEDQVDRYLLQFWPAPPGPDRVLRQTSEYADYWHRTAREEFALATAERQRRANAARA